MKELVRLTGSDHNRIVKESAKKVTKESNGGIDK